MKEAKCIDAFTEQEVVKVWEALRRTNYFNACTEGVAPPRRSMTPQQEKDWIGQNAHFQPVPTAFQNVILYSLSREGKKPKQEKDGSVRHFHSKLTKIVCAKDFPATDENFDLIRNGFTRDNLINRGADGLNPIEHAFQSRNAGLIRTMIHIATNSRMDKQINRAFLNAILREIEESCLRFDQFSEYPLKEFTDLLRTEGLVDNFFDSFEDDLALKETINAFILDRIFKWIEDEQPKMNALIRKKVYNIYKAFSSEFVASKAQTIVSDPSSELAKMMAIMNTPVSSEPQIGKINEMLGDEFTQKHGMKWLFDSTCDIYHLDNFFVNVANKAIFDARLKVGKLKIYWFVPIPGKGFRLVVSSPVQIGETVWQTREYVDTTKHAGAEVKTKNRANLLPDKQPSATSSTSLTSHVSVPFEKKTTFEKDDINQRMKSLLENDYESAMSCLDSLMELYSEDKTVVGKILFLKGGVQSQKFRSSEAIVTFKRLFEFKDANLEKHLLDQAHFACGAAHHALKQLDEASYHYGFVIANNSTANLDKVHALLNRAVIFEEQGDFLASLNDSDEAVKVGQECGVDPDLIKNLQVQIQYLKSAAPQSTAKSLNGAISSMITDR